MARQRHVGRAGDIACDHHGKKFSEVQSNIILTANHRVVLTIVEAMLGKRQMRTRRSAKT